LKIGNTKWANGVCETTEGKIITGNESDGNVTIWSKKGKLEKKIHSTGSHIISTIYHSKGYTIFGGYDKKVYIFKKDKEKFSFSVPEVIWRIKELENKNILIGFHA
jgi:hypothetical protein